MGQGKPLSDVQEEKLRHAFLRGDDVATAVRETGISESSIRKRYRALESAPPDNLAELRAQKNAEAVELAVAEMLDVRLQLIRAIPGTIPSASLRDIATGIGILTDKIRVETGQPTDHTRHSGTITHRDLSRFTDDEIEGMTAMAERLAAQREAAGT